MALIPLKIPPGFYRNGTAYETKGRWRSGNLVRFSEGRLRPIGGWTRLSNTRVLKPDGATPDPIRGLHSWRSEEGIRYLGVGSVNSLRIFEGVEDNDADTLPEIYNVTPTGILSTDSTCDTTSGSVTVTVDSSTNIKPGMAVSGSGVPEGATVDTVPNSTSFTLSASATATATDVTLTLGQPDFQISGLGYGALNYGDDYYGTPRFPNPDDIFAPVWSLDNKGDDLVGVHTGDGKLYRWEQANGLSAVAVQVTDSGSQLSGLKGVLVTPERHLMVLAPAGNVRKIRFATQDGGFSSADWTPSTTNTARAIELQTTGEIVGARKTRYGVLIFTTTDVFRLDYIGPPYVYSAVRIAEGIGPAGPNSIAGSGDFLGWISRGRMWSYSGGYIKELQCDVADYVFSDINLDIAGLIYGGDNPDFGELWWFYPTSGDETPTRYLVYSYRENHWVTGDLKRSAWQASGTMDSPVASGTDGYLYKHELGLDPVIGLSRSVGVTPPSTDEALGTSNRPLVKSVKVSDYSGIADELHPVYAETGAIEIGNGQNRMKVRQIVTDTEAGDNAVRLKFQTADNPDTTASMRGPFALDNDGFVDTRFNGRQIQFRVEGPFDTDWRVGETRVEGSPGGTR